MLRNASPRMSLISSWANSWYPVVVCLRNIVVCGESWNSGGGSMGATKGPFFSVLKFSALMPPSELSSESNCDTSPSLSMSWKGKN